MPHLIRFMVGDKQNNLVEIEASLAPARAEVWAGLRLRLTNIEKSQFSQKYECPSHHPSAMLILLNCTKLSTFEHWTIGQHASDVIIVQQ
jgi:hypothetical protein